MSYVPLFSYLMGVYVFWWPFLTSILFFCCSSFPSNSLILYLKPFFYINVSQTSHHILMMLQFPKFQHPTSTIWKCILSICTRAASAQITTAVWSPPKLLQLTRVYLLTGFFDLRLVETQLSLICGIWVHIDVVADSIGHKGREAKQTQHRKTVNHVRCTYRSWQSVHFSWIFKWAERVK